MGVRLGTPDRPPLLICNGIGANLELMEPFAAALVMAGTDDPIVPLVNTKFLASLIGKARLHVVDDGHLFLITRALDVAPVIRRFLTEGAAHAPHS